MAGPDDAGVRDGPAGRGPSPHRILNPDGLVAPSGFSHAVVTNPGRTVFLGGQTAHGVDRCLPEGGVVEQFDAACANLVTALAAAEAGPEHLVSVQIFVTDVVGYRRELSSLGRVWRRHFGHHYPAVALVEVRALFDPEALVELLGVAVVPG